MQRRYLDRSRTGPLGTEFHEIRMKMQYFLSRYAFENDVWKNSGRLTELNVFFLFSFDSNFT